jgi:hypothetical protein
VNFDKIGLPGVEACRCRPMSPHLYYLPANGIERASYINGTLT